MRIALGSDHAGRILRGHVLQVVRALGHDVQDLGCHTQDSVSYVDFAQAVAQEVLAGRAQVGVLVCGTGLGVSMAANKWPGVRAALCAHEYTAHMARAHNDANILCLGERVTGLGLAESIIKTFLGTPFAGGRHAARLEQMARMTDTP